MPHGSYFGSFQNIVVVLCMHFKNKPLFKKINVRVNTCSFHKKFVIKLLFIIYDPSKWSNAYHVIHNFKKETFLYRIFFFFFLYINNFLRNLEISSQVIPIKKKTTQTDRRK